MQITDHGAFSVDLGNVTDHLFRHPVLHPVQDTASDFLSPFDLFRQGNGFTATVRMKNNVTS